MNKHVLILLCLILAGSVTIAQHNVALQSYGQTTIFNGANPFLDAYEVALDGDTIYLSGGAFFAPTSITKGIAVFGAGFHLDSTLATLPTVINNSFTLGAGASNLHLEGMHLQSISKQNTTELDNVSIVRCRMAGYSMYNNGGAGVSNNFLLSQSVVAGGVDMYGLVGALVTNCILENKINNCESNTIANCIFLVEPSISSYVIRNTNNSIFSNNIFRTSYPYILSPGAGNSFLNNAFVHANPVFGTSSTAMNNYLEVDIATVFVNQDVNTFDYDQDYHLQEEAAATLLGIDDQQIGLYGGLLPFKEGAVPQNPHISFKSIDTQTNTSGELNIQIQVAAQND